MLAQSDPEFLDMLADYRNFDKQDYDSLFGRGFVRCMVRDAEEDEQLGAVNRRRNANSRRRGQAVRSRFYRPLVNNPNNGSSSSNFRFGKFQNARRGNQSRYVAPKLIPGDLRVGARIKKIIEFWPMFSKDPWILESIASGVKIDFLSAPFQKRRNPFNLV